MVYGNGGDLILKKKALHLGRDTSRVSSIPSTSGPHCFLELFMRQKKKAFNIRFDAYPLRNGHKTAAGTPLRTLPVALQLHRIQ
jgi:hypothetical protein